MKYVREGAFYVLDVKNPTTVADVATVCKRLDEVRRSQIRLSSTTTASDTLPLCNNVSLGPVRTIICNVVRDELERGGRVPP